MKKTLLVIFTLGAIALSACSSDETPDPPSGTQSPTPLFSDDIPQSDTPTPQADSTASIEDTSGWKDPAFCQVFVDSSDLESELTVAQEELNTVLADSENWETPEALAALHTQGQVMLDNADSVAAMFTMAAAEADDPEVAAGFSAVSGLYGLLYTSMGEAAVDAESVMDYATNAYLFLSDENVTALTDQLTELGPLMSDYVFETCGLSY